MPVGVQQDLKQSSMRHRYALHCSTMGISQLQLSDLDARRNMVITGRSSPRRQCTGLRLLLAAGRNTHSRGAESLYAGWMGTGRSAGATVYPAAADGQN